MIELLKNGQTFENEIKRPFNLVQNKAKIPEYWRKAKVLYIIYNK